MTCYVCKNAIHPPKTELGSCRFRHSRCAPGTVKWCRYFEFLPQEKRTTVGYLLYQHALDRKGYIPSRRVLLPE